jgi:molecular chaperone GrpE
MESEIVKDNSFYQGIEMIHQQLIKVLNDNGVDEIKSLGEDFNPNFHHAVFMEESHEVEEGKITEVLQKGYILKDKVIRPSMVKVAK